MFREIYEEENKALFERFELLCERAEEMSTETTVEVPFFPYFRECAGFILKAAVVWELMQTGKFYALGAKQLKNINDSVYYAIDKENYEESYANPAFAVQKLGEKYGQRFSYLFRTLNEALARVFEQRLFDIVVATELLIEIYNYVEEYYPFTGIDRPDPNSKHDDEALLKNIDEAIYYFSNDYSDERFEEDICRYVPGMHFTEEIVKKTDLTDTKYLYYYGKRITDNEIKTAEHLNGFSEDKIKAMASNITEGYIRGFKVMGLDFDKKKVVRLIYYPGFERVVREITRQFETEGKQVALLCGTMNKTSGYNRQYDYDHRYDHCLFYDNKLKERKLESMRYVLEQHKEVLAQYAGPLHVSTFGGEEFKPVIKKEAVQQDEKQKKISMEYDRGYLSLLDEYTKNEETSFCIVAYPLPDIGEQYDEIFDAVFEVNNLDNEQYTKIQQKLIDALDKGEYCIVKGMGANETDLKIMLHELKNPEKETNFENCAADVNIPAGEVFTSPKLSGTEGVLNVSKVYLRGLQYENLSIVLRDGRVEDYNCSNFETEEENKKYIRENVLYSHDRIAVGEFAIGTNTKAYAMAQKYDIQSKLPILIAEKTGPHFALGDTCYKRSEDHKVYNPDGKEIIARDNEVSILRKEDVSKAYFNCHTDITIPYDEVGEISVVCKDGSKIELIKDGRFVLQGTEELNEALEQIERR